MRIIVGILSLWLCLLSSKSLAAACADVFPGAASNAQHNGSVNINYGSVIYSTPGNSLYTNNLNDNAGYSINSCDTVDCTARNNLASAGNFNLFPNGQPDVTLAYQESRTLAPGNYNSLLTSSETTLTLQPGDYAFRGSFTTGFNTEIIVSSPGTVRIFVRGEIVFGSQNVVNSAGAPRYTFFFSRSNIQIGSSSTLNSYIYSRGSTQLSASSHVNGAITSRGNVTLISASSITYDAAALSSIDLGEFCNDGSVVDHYNIAHDGTGVTCAAEVVTITPHDSAHLGGINNGGVTINLSTSTGKGAWTGVQTGTPANLTSAPGANNGVASYTFAPGETSVSLFFNYPDVAANTAETFSINVSDGGITETTGVATSALDDPDFIFANTGFSFSGLVNNFVAGDTEAGVQIQAIRTDLNSGECVGLFADGADVAVELNAECVNPSSCAGVNLQITNNAITTNVATTADDGVAGTASVYTLIPNLRFGPDSTATLDLKYKDVGQLHMNIRKEIELQDGTPSGVYMFGSSNNFIVRPHTMVITDVRSGSTINPGTTSGMPGFIAAGEPFQVTVEVRDSENSVTPNYGNETVPEGIDFTNLVIVYPDGGDVTGLNLSDTFTRVVGSPVTFVNSTISWPQVGAFTVAPDIADGDYLASGGLSIVTQSSNIGRFYPHHFEFAIGSSIINSCDTFSYLSHDNLTVNFALSAVTSSGMVSTNYRNNQTNLSANYQGVATIGYVAENNNLGVDLGSRFEMNPLSPIGWVSGQYIASNMSAVFNRDTVIESPLTGMLFGVNIQSEHDNRDFDSTVFNMNAATLGDCSITNSCDAIRINASDLDVLPFYFGRLRLTDAFGPETADLPVEFVTEYWNGNLWVQNNVDNCTAVAQSTIAFPVGTIDILANRTVVVGGGTSTVVYADDSAGSIHFSAGDAGQYFTAPGAGNMGSIDVDVNLTLYPWLRSDWNQDGDYSDDHLPKATFTFGSYRGHDRIIFWREVLN
ncbi:DUF6701 domain-containing protein [Teredinibacter sp. KSP-S5-2]|uniref:DUF6701 domain-containing protein n=1 Tax=Teredinibacter sp. KSP-S5-2 TaxID=3034506 RepID=UPI002934546B|nr:DUF6701 domain-containing protein [Teredinibacter sp. KSP-S5-2]WNO09912.1 hypothetical protein P5V12_01865 [Teredinibacter sp. KSP-S5-2]